MKRIKVLLGIRLHANVKIVKKNQKYIILDHNNKQRL